ncbi:DegT/DnrJ/EryC1/StrS aminotransferase family protein [Nocardiopsis sp. HUAS JQ3]|uniref:DegT/DnrJ/EryC1/StrS family aminotransferase n=1 Tax=Nocardiopsis sp. HUAS JQ3 TaxID=3061629 RepID=UPI0023A99659|nr:aminotransferase class I/II-fold pyridoxal phosphate-dependent enzyme [Nocardiopsis sp. HUAS JQ3]WDZ90381.1 aminotransferase class I/II-fold pyridoxal phosphate-dependent enzyme [Nocardiopsis sp. HUAS JQ3]
MGFTWPPVDAEVRAAVARQLGETVSIYDRSGIIARFEDAFAARHSVSFALLTSSGTAALHSAYYALDIGPGDEVLVQDYTFFATATPLFQLGAVPVLVDVDSVGTVDLDQAARLLTPRTKALVITHMWGHPQDTRRLRQFCDQNTIALVEDCSHAHGAAREGVSVGQLADAACWSLQGRKTITAGEGGLLATRHQDVYEKATLLGHFNKRALAEVDTASPLYRYAETGLGLKYRAHPLGLAMAEVYLSRLDGWLEHRCQHAKRIEAVLAGRAGIEILTPVGPGHTPTLYAFVFTIDPGRAGFTREDLLGELLLLGCTDVSDCDAMRPLHTYPAFTQLRSPVAAYPPTPRHGDLSGAEWIAAHSLRVAVPADDSDQADRHTQAVVDALETALDRLGRG